MQKDHGKIYLDWAATALPNKAENAAALQEAETHFANPSAKHQAGLEARECLETAREKIAAILGVKREEIFFTSGGTESNHLALLANLARPAYQNYSIAVSSIEHPAVTEQAKAMQKVGAEVLTIPCDENGFVSADAVLDTVKPNTVFVSVMACNNEVGSLQPIAEIAAALKKNCKRPVHFHTDAVQALGKNFVRIADLGVDSLAMSAHKLGGLRGTGLLYLKKKGEGFIRGGGQEGGFRPGTENLAGALSLCAALEKYAAAFDANREAAREKTAFLISALSKLPDIVLIPQGREHGSDENFSPYIVQLAHKKIAGAVMQRALSDEGIFVSTGSACSSAKLSRPILQAMRVPHELQQNAFRVSLGAETGREELAVFVKVLSDISTRLT